MNLRKTLTAYAQSVRDLYRGLFSIEEIEREPILQWAFGGLLFFFFVTFNRWVNSPEMTIEYAERGAAVCWPYFQSCTDWFFLHEVGVGYSQTSFYMVLYSIMLIIVYAMWQKKWVLAHALMVPLLLWEILGTLVLSFSNAAPYHYYHIALTSILLFVPYKEFFLKLSFVFMYFMSVTTKLDPAWILGTYFTPLRDGLPWFPDIFIPLLTNLVIFMQIVGAWFLMSRNWILQRAAFAYFVFFHVYSGVFVLYFYPSVSLPSLLILFGPLYRYTPIPFSWKTLPGICIIGLLAFVQLLGFAAPGDRRLTLEGNKYGMFMFEANHQCIVTVGTYTKSDTGADELWEAPPGTACDSFFCRVKVKTEKLTSGLTLREVTSESGTAWNRCYPLNWWTWNHTRCDKNPDIEKVSLRMDHSINGGPFYRIVDLENICGVPFYPFGGNDWIRQPPEAPLIGFPVQNTYN